ncbi:MAG: glycoside hydrolase domain-containing protein, partial [Gemmatimonadota bacterium]
DDEPWRLSRLRWLNSQLAADGPPIAPYPPVRAVPGGFSILGRGVQLDALGFPKQVTASFSPEMTSRTTTARPLLASPFALQVEDAAGVVRPWIPGTLRTIQATASRAEFHSSGRFGDLRLDVTGDLEFDGNLEYRVALVATKNTPVHDIRLTIPMRRDVARLFMGLNRPGGTRPDSYDWKWDVATHNQDAFWFGDVNGGMQLTFKDEQYVRPLNTNFYLQSPLRAPRSWSNDGKGGCRFAAEAAVYRATCFSGPRTLSAGDTLWFNFRVLVTPFHTIDTKTHFSTRYMHAYKPVDTARAVGANLVNVHHATAINPFINYPFLRPDAMKAYADSLHDARMRFKIYYTVRELTNHAPEIWALRSLGTEVLASGPGGGHSWLQENMADNYLPGWYVPALRDVAMVTSGISRWHNFYVEGMQWLTQHVGVDGIYLDDVAFDRSTMQRIRRVLVDHGTPGERIDLHSATQYNKNDGFASSANLYLEHFPYIDRLWFGEYFNYDSPPDYWLVEMSGIPFGLMGEMLEGGGNPWRGMLFGMTNRLPWTGGDPRELWKAWDAFGINDATMHGWWAATPVTTDRKDVLATTYTRPGRALVAVASWAKDTVAAKLSIDWRALGLDPAHVRIYAPMIPNFQPARTFAVGEPIPVSPGKGWLLRIDPLELPARPGRLRP